MVLFSVLCSMPLLTSSADSAEQSLALAQRPSQQLQVKSVDRVDVAQLPLDDAFVEVFGNGSRHLYIFSDPDCPYCRRLELEFARMKDLTVHVFLFPIVDLHPEAKEDSIDVWCSRDRAKAWADLMTRQASLPARMCDNPIRRNVIFGEALGFKGTPMIIFPNGKVVFGSMSAEQLERILGPRS